VKILLIGKTGQLGGSLIDANDKHEFFAPSRDVVDIDSPATIEKAIIDFKPDLVINTAAFHNVPMCEVEPIQAFKTNCLAVGYLAKICKKYNSKLVTFSTDYVFGGDKSTPYTEDDKPNPLQIYGITRLAGEHATLSVSQEFIVIRTCGLYGHAGATSKGGNFVDKRISEAKLSNRLEMGCDQIVSPTYTNDLAEAIFSLIENPQSTGGIYHLVNQGQCTWYEFTNAIYEIMGLQVDLIPVNRGGLSGEMRRPLYSALHNAKANTLGIQMRNWKVALQDYIQTKHA
jgi:dTDP-4-dehydrorhamnose reductase